MTDYTSFRQRLDAVLRTLDVEQVQNFLIAEGQWSEGKPADPEFAMWMMIAGSPTLRDLHERAREWLMTHGHEADAAAFLTRDKKQGAKPNKGEAHKRGKSSPPDRPKAGGRKPNNSPTTSIHKKTSLRSDKNR